MAENQADDEDDEGFGDFKFVSYSNSNQNPNQDDDWGDFMDNFSPKQDQTQVHFQPSNGFFSHPPQNPSNPSETHHRNDVFGALTDPWMMNTHPLESQKSHVVVDSTEKSLGSSAPPAVEKRWEKLRGAIPLSIFGDEEEEEGEEPTIDDAQNLFSSQQTKNSSPVKKELGFGSGVGVNDLIANLYNQSGNDQQIQIENGLNSDPADGDDDFEEDCWEFKAAFPENRSEDGSSGIKIDEDVPTISRVQEEATTAPARNNGDVQVDREISKSHEGVSGQLKDDWFMTSDEFSYKPTTIENGFDFDQGATTSDVFSYKPTTVENGFNFDQVAATSVSGSTLDLFSQAKQIGSENTPTSSLDDGNFDLDENFTDFVVAVPETGATNSSNGRKEESEVRNQSDAQVDLFAFDGEFQGNISEPENHQGGFSLSTFSNGKLDSDDSLFGHDLFSFKPSASFGNGSNSHVSGSHLALSDLISNIYSQAEQIPAVGSSQVALENGFHMTNIGFSSDLLGEKDEFDENSWEFQGAVTEVAPRDSIKKCHIESKLKNYVEFYSKVKYESYSLALHHLHDLKEAEKAATVSGEDTKARAIHEEIEATYDKLHHSKEEFYLEERLSSSICVKELIEISKELKFQMLESEFHLSKRISLAEKELSSAIALFDHATLMVRILTMGSMDDQCSYVTAWLNLLSVCAKELKHGSLIWKRSLLFNVDKQILSSTRGQRYLVALGEIYRVVEVLRTSATHYKPWILSNLADPTNIFVLFDECSTAWSDSGLEEALKVISSSVSFEYERTIDVLLGSIKSIHSIDMVALENHIFTTQEPICRLSVLPMKMIPGMKTVEWNGEHYFLPLANLWINRVSCDPPKLQHTNIR